MNTISKDERLVKDMEVLHAYAFPNLFSLRLTHSSFVHYVYVRFFV